MSGRLVSGWWPTSFVLIIGIRVVDQCTLGLMCTRPQSHCVLNNIIANLWQCNYNVIMSLVEELMSLREGFVTFDCGNFL